MRKYYLNDDYFEKIDTPNKAYILGFLYADGNVLLKSKRESVMSICLQKQDKYILEAMLQEMQATYPIREARLKYAYFVISSNKLCSDLIKLGCIPKKSLILEWPTEKQVPKKLMRHFLRGYFDGDGCISCSKTGRHKYFQYVVDFVGTFHFCNQLRILWEKEFGLKNRTVGKRGKIYRVYFGGNQLIKQIYDYFYKDTELFLIRKKDKMIQVFDIVPYS